MIENNMNIDNPFDNVISDRKLKEYLGNIALALLASQNLISKEKDLNLLNVEFGYLLIPKGSEDVYTLMKITTAKKLFQSSKVFYLIGQSGNLTLLNGTFDENMFRKESQDMLIKHKVDINTINRNEYIMVLY